MSVRAQDILAMRIDLEVGNIRLIQVLNQLEQDKNINFAYSRNRIPLERRITISRKDTRLDEVLLEIFEDTGVLFQAKNHQIILYRDNKLKFTISGYIRDQSTRELLFGANIYEVGAYRGVYSNKSGFYSLTLPKGKYKIMATYIGYQTYIDTIDLSSNIEKDIYMDAGGFLREILVIGNPVVKNQEFLVKKKNDASHKIDVEKVNDLPSFFGEENVLSYLQLIPGTSSNGVLGSNLNIRGSEPEQNLILLDGIPVYNNLHFFGLVSIFDKNMVKSVDAYTHGFSALYGGKLSSIMDIRMKEGDKNNYHAQASVGLLSLKGFVEGPILKEKSSFIVSYRRSIFDILSSPKNINIIPTISYRDLNAKVNFDISKKDKLSFIYYQGNDLNGISDSIDSNPIGIDDDLNFIYGESLEQFAISWGNQIFATKWFHKLNQKAYLTTSVHYSRFNYSIKDAQQQNGKDIYALSYQAGVNQKGIKTRFDYRLNTNHYINIGTGLIFQATNPGKSQWVFHAEKKDVLNRDAKDIASNELYLFLEDEYKIDRKWSLQYGLYNSLLKTKDTTYFYAQPRMKLRYHLNDKSKIEASYSKMVQYDRILSSKSNVIGADMWLPSTRKVKPQLAHHFSMDYFYSWNETWVFQTGIFYKMLKNIVRPKAGVNVWNSVEHWEDSFEFGNGKAYGYEMKIEKLKGKTRGWLSYYLGKSTRQFDGINNGKVFPYKYSKTHNINIVLLHQFKSKKSRKEIGLTWQYASGYYTTIPTRWHYDFFGNKILDYDEINNYRFPATHTLNMSYTWSRTTKRKVNWTIKTGIYNLYRKYNIFNDELVLTDKYIYKLDVSSFTYNPVPYVTINFGLNSGR